jgi:hypothetical protein
MTTGIISNKDYLSSEPICNSSIMDGSPPTAPTVPPTSPHLRAGKSCVNPAGVDTFHGLIAAADADKSSFRIPAARRELIAVTGISKMGRVADVEFTWRWIPSERSRARLSIPPTSTTARQSTAGFREYDDGWRLVPQHPPSRQSAS